MKLRTCPRNHWFPGRKPSLRDLFSLKETTGFPGSDAIPSLQGSLPLLSAFSAAVVCMLAETQVEEEKGGSEGETAAGGI